MNQDIKCSVCGQCNRKGQPSVARGSLYCDVHQIGNIDIQRKTFYDKMKKLKWW